MARRKTRSSSRSRRSYRSTSGRRATYSRRSAGNYRRSSGRPQTLKIVLQHEQAPTPLSSPGVPGTVGVAALGPKSKSVF